MAHLKESKHGRARDAREIRYQTDLRVNVASLAYSGLYGNKVRKMWKLMAKNNELTNNSYDFKTPHACKVPECKDHFTTAMDMFRHVRENHLCTVKKLKIKIGTPPASPARRLNKPGPRSRTMKTKPNNFPISMLSTISTPSKDTSASNNANENINVDAANAPSTSGVVNTTSNESLHKEITAELSENPIKFTLEVSNHTESP